MGRNNARKRKQKLLEEGWISATTARQQKKKDARLARKAGKAKASNETNDPATSTVNQQRYDRRRQPNVFEGTRSLLVPTRTLGRIIGRGGSKIKELESTTGARARIPKGCTDENAEIKLSGSDSAILELECLILDIVELDNQRYDLMEAQKLKRRLAKEFKDAAPVKKVAAPVAKVASPVIKVATPVVTTPPPLLILSPQQTPPKIWFQKNMGALRCIYAREFTKHPCQLKYAFEPPPRFRHLLQFQPCYRAPRKARSLPECKILDEVEPTVKPVITIRNVSKTKCARSLANQFDECSSDTFIDDCSSATFLVRPPEWSLLRKSDLSISESDNVFDKSEPSTSKKSDSVEFMASRIYNASSDFEYLTASEHDQFSGSDLNISPKRYSRSASKMQRLLDESTPRSLEYYTPPLTPKDDEYFETLFSKKELYYPDYDEPVFNSRQLINYGEKLISKSDTDVLAVFPRIEEDIKPPILKLQSESKSITQNENIPQSENTTQFERTTLSPSTTQPKRTIHPESINPESVNPERVNLGNVTPESETKYEPIPARPQPKPRPGYRTRYICRSRPPPDYSCIDEAHGLGTGDCYCNLNDPLLNCPSVIDAEGGLKIFIDDMVITPTHGYDANAPLHPTILTPRASPPHPRNTQGRERIHPDAADLDWGPPLPWLYQIYNYQMAQSYPRPTASTGAIPKTSRNTPIRSQTFYCRPPNNPTNMPLDLTDLHAMRIVAAYPWDPLETDDDLMSMLDPKQFNVPKPTPVQHASEPASFLVAPICLPFVTSIVITSREQADPEQEIVHGPTRFFEDDEQYKVELQDDCAPTTQESRNTTALNMDFRQMFLDSEKHMDEYWAKFPKIVKNYYVESDEIGRMSNSEVEAWRKESGNIVVERPLQSGEKRPIPKPVKNFKQAFARYPDVLVTLERLGFTQPTPIQMQAWPILLKGEDLIGIAQTGTGKTLAFLLPAFLHIEMQRTVTPDPPGPEVLVIAPTRELAIQIDRECKKYSYNNITSICIYGGADRREQIRGLQRGVSIIIATPGRLDDLIQAGHIDTNNFSYVVLDEADRMLDMGFEPQIRKTMYKIRPDRQTVMTSATWPSSIRRLAQSYMKDPVQVYVGSLNLSAVELIKQTFVFLDADRKFDTFMDWAHTHKDTPNMKTIVFCSLKATAIHIASEMSYAGIYCSAIHGNLEQCDRESALEEIASDEVNFLVATDLASRGLDITCLTHVLNYDFPRNIEEYVHRIGRTGRAGRTGEAITYFEARDFRQAPELIKILEESNQEVPEELRGYARYAETRQARDAERRFGDRDRRGGGGGRGGNYSRGGDYSRGGGGGRMW